MLGNKLRN